MEMRNPFPIVRVEGSHYDIGFQIGTNCKTMVQASLERFKKRPNRKMPWEKVVLEAKKYLPYAEDFCPELLEEVRGCADGAQVKFEEGFALYCSDSFPESLFGRHDGCTDIAVCGELTADGSVIVAHNNDSTGEESTILVEAKPTDKPRFFAIMHGGVFPTVGFNSAGISITGNHLVPNDMRIGVPLGFTVRKVLNAKRIGEAMEFALPVKRASSYNQVVACSDGEIYSLEGSATDFEAIYAADGYIVHTNHYVTERMKKYEHHIHRIFNSIVRYNRALRLLKKELGNVNVDSLKKILTDHVNYPYSICRHENKEDPIIGEIKTIYSVIFDLTHLTLWLCRGNPCKGEYATYQLMRE